MHRSVLGIACLVVGAVVAAAGCGGGKSGGAGGRASHVTVIAPTPFANESFLVVVNDSSGAMVSSTPVAGASGNDVVVPAGGSVTLAAAVGTTNFGWNTVVEPLEGDTLTLANPIESPVPTPTNFQTWNVTLSAAPQNATQYRLVGPCGGPTAVSTAAVLVVTNTGCRTIGEARILALAYQGNQLAGWHETGALQLVAGGVTNESIAFDQRSSQSASFLYLHLEPSMSVSETVYLDRPGFVAGRAFLPSLFLSSVSGDVGYATVQGPPTGAVTTLEQAYGMGFAIVRVRHLGFLPGSESLDVGSYVFPSWPALDVPTGRVTWTSSGFGDGQVLQVWGQSSTELLTQTVVAPPGLDHVPLLQMPPSFTPSTLAQMTAYAFVSEADYASIASWDALLGSGPLPPSTNAYTVPDDAVFLFGGAD